MASESCLTEREAHLEMQKLQSRGLEASMTVSSCFVSFTEIRVLDLKTRKQAEAAATKLMNAGISSNLYTDGLGDIGLRIGPFADESYLATFTKAIQEQGYGNLEIGSSRLSALTFKISATRPETSQPAAFVFGEPPSETTSATASDPRPAPFSLRLDRGHIETGMTTVRNDNTDPDAGSGAETSNHVILAASARYLPRGPWEMRAGARLDGHLQTGDKEVEQARVDYTDSFVRYRGSAAQLTVGAQTPLWGRMDDLSPTDRMATVDLTRFNLDRLEHRRRASPALRLETAVAGHHVDALYFPVFRRAKLPDNDSIWHPVNRDQGRFLGRQDDPALAALIQGGRFEEGFDKDLDDNQGAWGLRVSRDGRGLDYALTLQRTRYSTPYYSLDENVRQVLLDSGDPAAALAAADGGNTFRARYPLTWIVGGDIGFEAGGITFRGEAAWLSDIPTTDEQLVFTTMEGVEWALGMEGFPGDRDARVTVQLNGRYLPDPVGVDDDEPLFLSGELESMLDRARWRLRLRFSARLDKRDVYANPEIAYLGLTAQELYLGGHYFEGSDGTAGGFFRNNRLAVAGWRGRF